MDNILQLIKERRNIKFFKNDAISDNILNEILDAGRWAPSAHNLQPWRFVVIKNKTIKKKIINIINKKSKKLYAGFNIILKDSIVSIENAPILVLAYNTKCVSTRFLKFGRLYKRNVYSYEIQSIAAAIQNMILMAYDRGIGSRWLGILSFCEKEINKLLGIHDNLIAVLVLGKPQHIPVAPKRIDLKNIITMLN